MAAVAAVRVVLESFISGYPMIARCDRTSVEALHAGDQALQNCHGNVAGPADP